MAWDRGVPQAAEEGDESAIKYMEVMQFGQIEKFREMQKLYQQRAYWILEQVKKGELPKIYAVDDPKTVIEVMTKYILSAEFQEQEDEFQQEVLDQMEMLQKNLEAKQAQIAQNQGARQGQQASPPDQQAQLMAMGQGGMPPQQQGIPPGQTGEMPPIQEPLPGGGAMVPPVAPMPGQGGF